MEASNEALYRERLERILTTVALNRPDRTPVVLEYSGFAAWVTGTPMAEFISSPAKATETMMAAYELIGDGDAVNYGSFSPYGLSYSFLAKVRLPGRELPDNELWQVVETELMTAEDYDRILAVGWPVFFAGFMAERIFDDAAPELIPANQKPVDARGRWAELAVPVLSGGDVTTPIELLCGARSMTRFAFDMFNDGDKVEAVMAEIAPHLAGPVIAGALERGFPAVWVGGWRSAPAMLSPAMWDRFAWPHFRALVEEVVEAGLIAILHLDSDWTRELARFRELPKGRCIVALDGDTDIFKAKEILGDHLCLMGDVPATMLFTGTPDEVHAYCTKLISELGPEGFILQSGCDIPANAKLENVKAMVAAATGG